MAVGVALLLVAGLVVALSTREAPGVTAADATVTASSTALGRSPRAAVTGPDDGAAAAGAGWQSADETVGAWLELAWPQAYEVRRVVVERPPGEAGVTDGVLSFSDGSQLQVRLSTTSPRTEIPLGPRRVDRVRFTAAAVAPGARHVTISHIDVDDVPRPDDVDTGTPPGGDAATSSTPTVSTPGGSAGDPRALVDGTPEGATGADWTDERPAGTVIDLRWDRPRELTSVAVVGRAGAGSRLAAATVTFSDGATLPVGATSDDRPTVVAFMPRVTTSVRLTVDRVTGSGPLTIAEIRTTTRGATPERAAPPAADPSVRVLAAAAPEAACPPAAPVGAGLVIRCPVSGTVVDGQVLVEVGTAPGYDRVAATPWPGDPAAPPGATAVAGVDPGGTARAALDVGDRPGPLTVAVTATGPGRPALTASLQLERRGPAPAPVPSEPAAAGRSLVYDEEFDRPVSASRTGAGADYAAAKPTDNGVQDFGDGAFADPAGAPDHYRVDDGSLRLGIRPGPDGRPAGALLASARPGGSGFSAQYGYFEARMLAPAAPGTWPAFWALPADNLIAPTPAVAEIDAVELYGHEPTGACQSTHDYRGGRDLGIGQCGPRFADARDALAWHTYGVDVTPTANTFTIDGRVVATAPQVPGGSAPLFFLTDLALGGGWPVDLGATGGRATLYVDYVRVFV